jgi:ElaB/YqjD/DUF883 family membrane-anchored ribosome-binding protein
MERKMETTSHDIKSALNGKGSLATDAKHVANNLMETPMAKQISGKYEEFRTAAVDSYDSSLEYVRKNPIRSAAVALGFGVIAGLILRGGRSSK